MAKEKIIEHGNDDKRVISDKPTRSGYVPGSLYKKMESKKVKFKETDNTKEEINPIAFIEKHYPETARAFQEIQYEQYETFCKKQMDYGPSNISMGTSLVSEDEKRLSLVGLIVRINDKIQRLMNLIVKHNREAQNEPTIDAFKDLSVYGIIAQIVGNGKWGI